LQLPRTPPFNKILYVAIENIIANPKLFQLRGKICKVNHNWEHIKENKMCKARGNKYQLDKGKLE
jgi:hypothetical protein